MIQLIISLYRGAIGILFVLGAGAATIPITTGTTTGLLIGIGILTMTIFAVGLSAVLISINDRLAPTQGDRAASSRALGQRIGIAIAAVLAILVSAHWLLGTAEAPFADTVASKPAAQLSAPDSNGCVPELAAEVGMRCSR